MAVVASDPQTRAARPAPKSTGTPSRESARALLRFTMSNSDAITPRGKRCFRHCERSEAIQRSMQAAPGLLPPTRSALRRTQTHRSSPCERRRVVASAPRNDEWNRSRDACASELLFKRHESSPQTHVRHFHFASPDNEGSGAPTGAVDCTCYQAQSGETAPVTGNSRGPHDKGRSPFGAPLRIDRTFVLPRPGPALPGITGSKREVCTPSPAPVQRAPRSPNTCRTGMMPRPPADQVTNLTRRTRTRSAKSRLCR